MGEGPSGGRRVNSYCEGGRLGGGGSCGWGIGGEFGGGKMWGRGGKREDGKERYLLHAFILLLLGFEALAGGDGGLEVWRAEGGFD